MQRTYTNMIKKGKGEIFLQGWVHELRDLAKIKFILLRDAEGIVQCVITDKALFEIFSKLTMESVIAVKGEVKEAVVKSQEVINNKLEVNIKELEIVNKAETLPISVNEKTIQTALPKRLDFRCIDLRARKNNAIFKIQSAIVEGMQKWLNENGFVQVFTPCLMAVGSESGAEVFSVNYFDRKAYLRQDPQLHRQLTIASGFERIYDIGPSGRAEKSHTVKHLTEHRTCAVELGFIANEQDTMKVEEQVVISALKNVKDKCKKELELFGIDITIPTAPFPELKFPALYSILNKLGKKIKEGADLDSEAEKLLADFVKEKYGSDFFFINCFPFKLKPFYVYSEGEYARSVDLYCKNLELSSGGQREHRYDKLIKNVKEKGMAEKETEWFTQFFKWGVPTHGGFAIGIERLTQVLLNLENIREAVLFPRDTERLSP
ncbi:aspartate--tRNA(Asn) ligase [archaeon]|nr:aspartate--tRNA(Asn) ligase [archaeon]